MRPETPENTDTPAPPEGELATVAAALKEKLRPQVAELIATSKMTEVSQNAVPIAAAAVTAAKTLTATVATGETSALTERAAHESPAAQSPTPAALIKGWESLTQLEDYLNKSGAKWAYGGGYAVYLWAVRFGLEPPAYDDFDVFIEPSQHAKLKREILGSDVTEVEPKLEGKKVSPLASPAVASRAAVKPGVYAFEIRQLIVSYGTSDTDRGLLAGVKGAVKRDEKEELSSVEQAERAAKEERRTARRTLMDELSKRFAAAKKAGEIVYE